VWREVAVPHRFFVEIERPNWLFEKDNSK